MSRFRELLMAQVKIIAGGVNEEVRLPIKEWEGIFHEAEDTLIRDVGVIAPDIVASARKITRRGKLRRDREVEHTRRAHLKKLGIGFRQLEEAAILAEASNRNTFDAFSFWLKENDGNDEILASSIGAPETLGGPVVRVLTFLGLHARGCTIVSEILLLCRHGFVKGAHSRARSLYELATIMGFLTQADSPPYVLTERYSLSALVETRRDLLGNREDDPFDRTPGLEDAIRNAWGESFFKSYGWAIPGIGDGSSKQVTFRDIEQALGSSKMRHAYLTMNHSVHAGAASIIAQFDNRAPFRYRTGSSVDYYDAAWVMSVTALLLEGLQIPMSMDISPLMEADLELDVAPIVNLCDSARKFFDDYIRADQEVERL